MLLRKIYTKLKALHLFLKYNGNVTKLALSTIQNDKQLCGKRIIVTGGSDGIGLAMAQKFILCGAQVLITGRNEDKLLAAKEKINSQRLQTMTWDITDLENTEVLLQSCISRLGETVRKL